MFRITVIFYILRHLWIKKKANRDFINESIYHELLISVFFSGSILTQSCHLRFEKKLKGNHMTYKVVYTCTIISHKQNIEYCNRNYKRIAFTITNILRNASIKKS